jgi:hypothetical protein
MTTKNVAAAKTTVASTKSTSKTATKKTAAKKTATKKSVAKKTTGKKAAAIEVIKAANGNGDTVITLRKNGVEEAELPHQALGILRILKAHKGSMTTAKLIEEIGKRVETTQSPKRILTFYRKPLVDAGWIKIQK